MFPLLILTTYLVSCTQASTLPKVGRSRLPRICGKGQFLKDSRCTPCSPCPANTYISQSCSRVSDTQCEMFTIENTKFGQDLEPAVFKRNVTREKEETVFRQNASECFINARKEDALIKSLIAALVIVMLMFIGYIIFTKCCHNPPHKDQGTSSCDHLITTVPEPEPRYPPPVLRPEPQNFVIGPDGTKIPEEQYLKNPMRALTSKGRSQVLINNSNHSSPRHHGGAEGGQSRPAFYGVAQREMEVDMVSLSSVSGTSVVSMDV